MTRLVPLELRAATRLGPALREFGLDVFEAAVFIVRVALVAEPEGGLVIVPAVFRAGGVGARRELVAPVIVLVLRIDPAWKVRGDRRIFGVMTRDLKWIN